MPPPARAAVATGPGVPEPAVAARSSWAHILHRLLHDPVAILSFALLTVVVLGVFAGAPLAAHLLGHGPNDVFLHSVGDGLPAGPWTHVRNLDESYVHTDGTTLFYNTPTSLRRLRISDAALSLGVASPVDALPTPVDALSAQGPAGSVGVYYAIGRCVYAPLASWGQ
jgi:hypothetical protein